MLSTCSSSSAGHVMECGKLSIPHR